MAATAVTLNDLESDSQVVGLCNAFVQHSTRIQLTVHVLARL